MANEFWEEADLASKGDPRKAQGKAHKDLKSAQEKSAKGLRDTLSVFLSNLNETLKETNETLNQNARYNETYQDEILKALKGFGKDNDKSFKYKGQPGRFDFESEPFRGDNIDNYLKSIQKSFRQKGISAYSYGHFRQNDLKEAGKIDPRLGYKTKSYFEFNDEKEREKQVILEEQLKKIKKESIGDYFQAIKQSEEPAKALKDYIDAQKRSLKALSESTDLRVKLGIKDNDLQTMAINLQNERISRFKELMNDENATAIEKREAEIQYNKERLKSGRQTYTQYYNEKDTSPFLKIYGALKDMSNKKSGYDKPAEEFQNTRTKILDAGLGYQRTLDLRVDDLISDREAKEKRFLDNRRKQAARMREEALEKRPTAQDIEDAEVWEEKYKEEMREEHYLSKMKDISIEEGGKSSFETEISEILRPTPAETELYGKSDSTSSKLILPRDTTSGVSNTDPNLLRALNELTDRITGLTVQQGNITPNKSTETDPNLLKALNELTGKISGITAAEKRSADPDRVTDIEAAKVTPVTIENISTDAKADLAGAFEEGLIPFLREEFIDKLSSELCDCFEVGIGRMSASVQSAIAESGGGDDGGFGIDFYGDPRNQNKNKPNKNKPGRNKPPKTTKKASKFKNLLRGLGKSRMGKVVAGVGTALGAGALYDYFTKPKEVIPDVDAPKKLPAPEPKKLPAPEPKKLPAPEPKKLPAPKPADAAKLTAKEATEKVATKEIAEQAAKQGSKGAAKIGGKALGKSALKKIPGIGLLAGTAFAIDRMLGGDFTGAGLEFTSGLAGTIPGLGTAASVGIDATLMARDMGAFDKEEGQKGVADNLVEDLNPETKIQEDINKEHTEKMKEISQIEDPLDRKIKFFQAAAMDLVQQQSMLDGPELAANKKQLEMVMRKRKELVAQKKELESQKLKQEETKYLEFGPGGELKPTKPEEVHTVPEPFPTPIDEGLEPVYDEEEEKPKTTKIEDYTFDQIMKLADVNPAVKSRVKLAAFRARDGNAMSPSDKKLLSNLARRKGSVEPVAEKPSVVEKSEQSSLKVSEQGSIDIPDNKPELDTNNQLTNQTNQLLGQLIDVVSKQDGSSGVTPVVAPLSVPQPQPSKTQSQSVAYNFRTQNRPSR